MEGLESYAAALDQMGGNMGSYLLCNTKKLRQSKDIHVYVYIYIYIYIYIYVYTHTHVHMLLRNAYIYI